jgi:hypothetical protein
VSLTSPSARAGPRCRRGCTQPLAAVFYLGRVERRAPTALVVPGQLEIEALARHPDGDVPDAGPGVQPGTERVEGTIVRGHGAPGEAEAAVPRERCSCESQ